MPSNTSEATAAPRPGEARRRLLVETTIRLASHNGVNGASVKDIGRAAGVAPGLVHYYFASKEELLVSVVDRLDADLQAIWRLGVAGAVDPLDRLVDGLHAVANDADAHPEYRRLLTDLATASMTSPLLHDRCEQLWSSFRQLIEGEIRQVLGQLPTYSLASPHDLATVIAGALDGVMLQAMVCNSSPKGGLRTLVVMVLSVVATAYLVAGETPPMDRLRELAMRR